MVTTHTVTVKPLVPLGGADRAGRKVYFGVYTTEAVHAHSYIQLSPKLNVSHIDIKDATNQFAINLASGGHTASTGSFLTGTATATTGVSVLVVGR